MAEEDKLAEKTPENGVRQRKSYTMMFVMLCLMLLTFDAVHMRYLLQGLDRNLSTKIEILMQKEARSQSMLTPSKFYWESKLLRDRQTLSKLHESIRNRRGVLGDHEQTLLKSILFKLVHDSTRSLLNTKNSTCTCMPGRKGERGRRGKAGPRGIEGEKGDPGKTGHGSAGPQGQRGTKGDKGEGGRRGKAGLRGIEGEKGDTGKTGHGTAGPQGQKGTKGDKGEGGPPGKSIEKPKVKTILACEALRKQGYHQNGIFTISPGRGLPFAVFCDMTTKNHGWIVIQRRSDGTENFLRRWSDYKNGFGDQNNEFWLGLDKIHQITSAATMVIRFDLEDTHGNKKYAEYDSFSIDSEKNKFMVHIGKYSGTAGDSFSYHNGVKFSTIDQDNDSSSLNCAQSFSGAWWYSYCATSNLNGKYLKGHHTSLADGINWFHWKGNYYSLAKTEIKLRVKT